MKIFTSAQIRELDKYTIDHEPIKSIDLMERAAKAITQAITSVWSRTTPMVVFAGPGNNGGDALAVTRMLLDQGYNVQAFLFNISGHLSEDCAANRLVKYINSSPAKVVSIDVPSGLMTEDNSTNVRANIIRADLTLTLGQKKLSFLFSENQQLIGQVKVLDIRLSQEGIDKIDADYAIAEENDIRPLLLKRNPYAHKGNMGNALIIAGSYGMAGASVLATKACFRSGAGKVTTHTPKQNSVILQISVPEAIIQFDRDETIFSEAVDTEDFDALGIGPGLGTSEQTAIALITQIRGAQCPIVADADAINILANHRAWLQQMPKGIIFTPHPKELERLEGHSNDSYEKLSKARNLAERVQGYVILKGHHSALCLPNGHVIFNSTGNAGMATAGSGDVLTGILTGLLARGYKQQDACLIGMYLHGLAGDIAARELGQESLMAGDIIHYLPYAFKKLRD